MIQGEALLLIYKGSVNKANCKSAEITLEELAAAVREHGAKEITDVDLAMLEVDGNISVISNDFHKHSQVIHPKKHKLKGRLLQN
jgi:uncharacterized membrane protein YcaP (DUF421 family)